MKRVGSNGTKAVKREEGDEKRSKREREIGWWNADLQFEMILQLSIGERERKEGGWSEWRKGRVLECGGEGKEEEDQLRRKDECEWRARIEQ